MGKSKPNIDWVRIERSYRAGLLTVVEISNESGEPGSSTYASPSLIAYHARTRGWKRDLTAEVRASTRTKMVENLAHFNSGSEAIDHLRKATDEDIIEQAARTQVEVVRQHQKTLGQGHDLTLRMLNELDTTTTYKGELEEMIQSAKAGGDKAEARKAGAMLKILSLNSRITALRDLAISAKTWISEERRAFGIADDREGTSADQRKLDEMTAEQLREEILNDAKKLGLHLTAENLKHQISKSNGVNKVH